MQELSKDYIREFGKDQEKKKLPITFKPQDDLNFNQSIQKDPVKKTPKITPVPPHDVIAGGDQISLSTEGITENDLKEMVQSAVLDMMNVPLPHDNSLLESQKQEIQKIIANYWDRPGLMSICFREDVEKDEASVGMLIDPTNTQNWVFLKEEIIYKLPYAFKQSLHSFASKVWKDRNLVLEAELPNTEQIQLLKTQIAAAHREADARYNEVAHQSTGFTPGNPFEPNRVNHPDTQEGHRNALADGQYRALKKRAIDLEVQFRRLEKKFKNNKI